MSVNSCDSLKPFLVFRCVCSPGQISDGWRCYGDIMERVLELDREGSQAGNLTGSIALFGSVDNIMYRLSHLSRMYS